jgi:DNA-binding NarL/FixJ family response regulator
MKANEAIRQLKDPAALTPYEQRIWDMRCQGLTNGQIGKALNQLPSSIASRMRAIKEKIELQDALRLVG